VYSTDADILNRRGKEQFDALDSMFAIGNMPESIPRRHPAREPAREDPDAIIATATGEHRQGGKHNGRGAAEERRP
jgi:hypothetical protein